jgi:large subunit ribosomal protein L32
MADFLPLTGRKNLSRIGNFHAETDEDLSMAVPKRRQSNAKTGSRRAHDFKKPKELTYCPQCSTAVPTHRVCPKCGYYMGRTIIEQEKKKKTKKK